MHIIRHSIFTRLSLIPLCRSITRNGRLTTAVLYATVCLVWGTTWLAIKLAVESVPPLTAAGGRFLIAFPMFLAFAMNRKEPILYPRKSLGFMAFIIMVYFTTPYWLLNYGEQFVSAGLAALLFSTMPIFILIFSRIILRERIFLSQIMGILLGFGALAMIIRGEGMELSHEGYFGIAAILAAAIMHGLSYVVTKRWGSGIGIVTFNTLPIGIAGLVLFSLGLITEQPDFQSVTSSSALALLYLGIVASVGGFIIYFYLLKKLSPVILSFVFIIFPAISVAIDAWYFQKPLHADFIFNMILLMIGFTIAKFPLETLASQLGRGGHNA